MNFYESIARHMLGFKICKSCNKPLSKISNISKGGIIKEAKPAPIKDEMPIPDGDSSSDDFSDSFEVPSVSRLQYDIDYSTNNVFKGSDILNISEEDLKEAQKPTKKASGTRKRKTNVRRKKRAD